MKSKIVIALALTFGVAIGAASAGLSTYAGAQDMHGQSAMPGDMMKMSKSAADKEMMAAMMRMQQSMMALKTTGNPDRDFMMMMIPHHRAAIDMATVELKYGKDNKVKVLAKAIISAQQHEIGEMSKWLNR